MQHCLTQETIIMIRDAAGEVRTEPLSFFDPLLAGEPDDSRLSQYLLLSRSGWSAIEAVSRRRLWENEQLYHIMTRSGRISLTGDHSLPVKRGIEELSVPASQVKAGDALLMLEQPRLGKKAPPLGEDPSFRAFGVLSVTRETGYEGNVYQVETADGTFVANGFLVQRPQGL